MSVMQAERIGRRQRVGRVAVTLAVLVSALGLEVMVPNRASAAAPVIENTGSVFEHNASSDDAGRVLAVTVVVRHDVGQVVTGIAFDTNYDGTDNTPSVAPTAVTAQQPSGGFNYSRVSVAINPPRPGGLSCGFLSGTRSVTVPVRLRAVTADGQRTGVVSQNMVFHEDGQCTGVQDPVVLQSHSQNLSSITPGQTVTFSFVGDDADAAGSSDDQFDRIRWRARRLNDGAIVQGPTTVDLPGGDSDNVTRTLDVTFPQRGRFVVEAELGNEDGVFRNAGSFFRLGAVDVNTAASTSPVVSLSGPAGVVQQGQTVTVNATAVDTEAFQGRVQMIEWDAENNGTFERRELANTEAAGLTATELQQSVDTTGLSGTRTVTARVTDNGAMNGADTIRRQDTASFAIVINRAPVANNQTVNTNEDTNASFALNASDPDGDTLTYSVTNPPDNGDLTGTAPNLTYDPDPNYHGSDSFTYQVTDGRGGSDTAIVTINVASVNDAPVAQDQSIVTAEDNPFNGTVTATDVDHATLTFSLDQAPAKGSATVAANGAFTYTPDGDENGSDSFTFEVCDPANACDSGTVNVTIDAVNDPPVPVDQDVTTDEDTALPITLDATDVDGDPLIFGIATPPVNGTLSGVAPNLTYTPDENFFGSDTFTFSVSDGASEVTGTVDITVNAVNDAPVAQDQAVVTDEDTAISGTLGATDVDDDESDLAFGLVGGPANGSADVDADGSFTYTPAGNFNGSDSFSFEVCDPDGACDEGTVDITVNPVNDPPVADDQDVTTDEDTPIPITLTASDADGNSLTFAVDTPPASGTLAGVAPNLQYTPDPNFFGSDSFTFTVSDGDAEVTGAIDITVDPVNDAPVAEAKSIVTDEDTAFAGSLDAADVDDDAVELTFELAEGAADGTAEVQPDGSFTYTPDTDFNGTDAFTFEVCDPDGACDQEVVEIEVAAVNDAPVASDDSVATDEDETITIGLQAADVDGDDLTYSLGQPEHGEVVGAGPEIAYTPDPNYHGPDSFTFEVSDGNGGTDVATIAVTVNPVNDAPDAIPQLVSTAEDTPLAVGLTAFDIDGDDVTFSVTEQPAHGTVTGDAPDVVYTPDADFTGNDFFTFEACDGDGACDEAIVSVVVNEVAMIPTALDARGSIATVQLNLLEVPLNLRATLTRADTGEPLLRQTVRFFTGTTFVCEDTTDELGLASCGGVVAVVQSVGSIGFRAVYAGDADHLPSSANGALVRIRIAP